MSALVHELATALDGAEGLGTPALASRLIELIDRSTALPPSVGQAVRVSVMRVCDTDDWSITARDLREAAQALKNPRG